MANHVSSLTDSEYQTLSNLLNITRGGVASPLAADYLRLKNYRPIDYLDILQSLVEHRYLHRHQLLLDLISYLFWYGRFMWRPRHLVIQRWENVLADKGNYWLPDAARNSVPPDKPVVKLMRHTYSSVLPSLYEKAEDLSFATLIEILSSLPVGELAGMPQIAVTSVVDDRRSSAIAYFAEHGCSSPVYDSDLSEIADRTSHSCSDKYLESLLRFTVLLSNQYFWSGDGVQTKPVSHLKPEDWVFVCASDGTGEKKFGVSRSGFSGALGNVVELRPRHTIHPNI